MQPNNQTIVVGGGIIGLSIAWNLAKQGCRVTLLERDQVGRATSWAGAGILPPANLAKAADPIDQLRGYSHQLFPAWAEELEQSTGIDSGLRHCGGWYLANSVGERAAMVGMTGYWDQLGIECESVPLQELARREPALSQWADRNQSAAAWWVPDEYQLRTPHYLKALRQACLLSGVQIETECSVQDVRDRGTCGEVLVADQWRSADSIILCCGVWISQVGSSLRLERSVIPIRGQILLLKTPEPISTRVINMGQRYLVCRDDGHILVGSCEEETGLELGTTEVVMNGLQAFAESLVPSLKSAEQRGAWSGLRPLTFDGFPMIGRVPDCQHVFVAGGHFRSGLHLSPGTAAVITDLVLGRQPAIPVEAFRVGKQRSHSPSNGPAILT